MPSGPASTITVRVLLFARFAELLGAPELEIELGEPATITSLLAELRKRAGAADLPPSPLVARNQVHVQESTRLSPGDEVAILPPLAGG